MKLIKVFTTVAMLFVVLMSSCDKNDDPGIHPTVSSTDPAKNATSVSLNHTLVVNFSEAMDQNTINASTFIVKQGSTTVAGQVGYAGLSGTFTPSANFEANKNYSATLTTGAKNIAGISIDSDYKFSFTTGNVADVVSPTLSATSPPNNASSISRNTEVTITFSEAMNPLTISTTTFTVKQGTTPISGTVISSGTKATFTPSTFLSAATTYTATVTTEAKDLAGNALATSTSWNFTTGGNESTLATIDLGVAANYVILAKTAINNHSTSAITGDLGLSPAAASYITAFALTKATGYATSAQVTGKIYAADMASPTPINLTTAVNNMITAYNDAAGRPIPDFTEVGAGNIGGKTLLSGLYKWTSNVTIPTDVTISGGADDVWIFQISGNLTMSSAKNIILTGGAQAKNIFWQVAGQATIGTTAKFKGNILSMTGITFQTGASLEGRALAQTAVILDKNVITKP
jgi:hypothetical protein